MAKYGMFPRKVLIDEKTGVVISAKNLTDEIAKRLLKDLPSAKRKIYEVEKYEALGSPKFSEYQALLIFEEMENEKETEAEGQETETQNTEIENDEN